MCIENSFEHGGQSRNNEKSQGQSRKTKRDAKKVLAEHRTHAQSLAFGYYFFT